MHKKLFTILKYIFFLGLGIFFIWWQLKEMTAEDKEDFKNALLTANYWLIPIIVVMSLLSHLSRCLRWKILLEPMGYNPKLSNMFCSTMVGYLANSAVPRLGEVLKCTFLSRYEKIPIDKLIGTIVLERIFDLICFVAFIGFTIVIEWSAVSGFIKENMSKINNINWLKTTAILIMISFLVFVLTRLFIKFKKNRFVQRLHYFILGFKDGLFTIKNLKRKKLFIIHTFIIWSLYLLQIYVGFSAMEQVAHLGIGSACVVLTLATFAMILTPGGIGAFPAAVMLVLAIYKIPEIYGQSFGWLMWGASTAIVIVTGFVCIMILPYINKNKFETSGHHIIENLHT